MSRLINGVKRSISPRVKELSTRPRVNFKRVNFWTITFYPSTKIRVAYRDLKREWDGIGNNDRLKD